MSRAFISLAALLGAFNLPVAAADARNDFSIASNPNGDWSYGYSATLGGPFQTLTNRVTTAGNAYWYGPNPPLGGGPGYPIVGYVPSMPATSLLLHPGQNGEYALLRWTSPLTGVADVAVTFAVGDSRPTTTDVHVLLNGVALFSGPIDGSNPSKAFSQSLSVSNGDKLDFAVGFGANGNYLFDSTLLTATVSAVPEPSALLLLLAGSGLVSFSVRAQGRKSHVHAEA